jgi:nitrous oxide reductase accessory protein NosL
MARAMWARTWKVFQLADRPQEACSFHCLVDRAVKSAADPQNVKTALFLEPRGMIPAEAAWYVVGSSAAGTMTPVSKAAFLTKAAALDFARVCGGAVRDYAATFQAARDTLVKENAVIDRKRLAKGRIQPPVDLKDECVVCRMYPARYPRHCSQVAHPDGHIDHFCSTHCLFSWLGDPSRGSAAAAVAGIIWVTDFSAERWISARTAYYVVDSRYVGPMGAEAVAFDHRTRALDFTGQWGGRVLTFDQVDTGSSVWSAR